ncbi:LysR family transcriptional regulator [Actibacterium sp. 188UL27-1]|uniref:LysR family transcriptional regulator n=1 Tax=Actibacterium sp. 188UL27-1 TaxID=2786961 RepID=UPI0019578224|nr:LysR family transcriptional regulator [Actibacterium sp. 188UL27-1]MBM7068545.1 LysR family transcriptional regulator [Actibacterium sp. 188UL27-1]
MKHLQIYHAFRAVVKEGSIRKAAETMGISASALNRQMAGLEAELQVTLFDRRATGVRLSAAGEIYYRQFIEHIARLDSAKITVADLQGARIGHVSVAVSPELAQGFFPFEIKNYREMYPRVTFSVVPAAPTGFEDQLNRFEADLALIVQPEFTDGVEVLAMADLPLCAITDRDTLPLDAFQDADLILPARSLGLRVVIDLIAKRKRLNLRPALETLTSIPPALMPPGAVQLWLAHDLVDPNLAKPLPQLGHPTARIVLGQRKGHSLSVAASKFANQLVKRLAHLSS